MDTIPLLFSLLLSVLMTVAFFFDLTRYILPNWLNLLILLLYPVFVLLAPVTPDWPMALAGLGVMFLGGFALYFFHLMGAGDIKLLMVLAVWCGWSQTLLLLILYTALLGGALAVGAFAARLMVPGLLARWNKETPLPRFLTYGEPIPYGMAISVAFLILLWTDKVKGLGAPVL